MANAAILNFTESPKLGKGDIRVANTCIYPHTRLYSTFIGVWDMAKNKIQYGGRRHFEFEKNWNLG